MDIIDYYATLTISLSLYVILMLDFGLNSLKLIMWIEQKAHKYKLSISERSLRIT